MHKLFCLMGKSASGKDTIFRSLLLDESLGLHRVIPYTTRPIREGEENGREYYFVSPEQFERFRTEGKILEQRCYDTVYGPWHYFTADDGQIDLSSYSSLMIGTPQAFVSIRECFGADKVIPVCVTVEDGERLLRAVQRERREEKPRYDELCRRFLADQEDFSKKRLLSSGVTNFFDNTDLDTCIREIADFIRKKTRA